MKALRKMVFEKVGLLMDIKEIKNSDIPGYKVSLASALTWLIREQRLHGLLLVRLLISKCYVTDFITQNTVYYYYNLDS